MDLSSATTIVDLFQNLPESGPSRARGLQRLVEKYAAAHAMSALKAAAARATAPSMAGALSSAVATLDGTSGPDATGPVQAQSAATSPAFLALVPDWIRELRAIAVTRPGTGACTIATAMQLWTWTVQHFERTSNAAAIGELTDGFARLLAARALILEVANGTSHDTSAPGALLVDLCHVQSARAAGDIGTLCAELVFGYRRHLHWDAEGCATCYRSDDLDELEGLIPGIASEARAHSDVIEADGSHASKAGPCVLFEGVEAFTRLRARLDGCLTGARLAWDRAAAALPDVLAGRTTAIP